MGINEFISENKMPIAFTAVFMLLISLAYAVYGKPAEMSGAPTTEVFDGILYKVAFTDSGDMKIFALAKSNELAALTASEGNSLPETNSMVIGATEAEMMRKEKLFEKPGDLLTGFFGINAYVEGVLEKTGQPIDMFHFMSQKQFEKINGAEGRIFSRLTADKVPKMFYTYDASSKQPFKMNLAERSVAEFGNATIDSVEYCPVIVGSEEAKMMRSEGLFVHAGDTIKGFFGNNVFIAGVLEKTGTNIDNFHLVSADCTYK